eukprot:XP_024444409.1 eukaryotic translation initiation factor 3 subunit J-like isoform X2 [Populus trichocarpa]
MEDWEDVQVRHLLSKEQPKNKWDDEDVDEDDVKESWEDEDEPAPAPVVKPPPENAPNKSAAKSTEKKGKTVQVLKEEKLDPLAEKLRQQRFSIIGWWKKLISDPLQNCLLRKVMRNRLIVSYQNLKVTSWNMQNLFHKSYHYIGLLKAIMKLSMTAMKAADAKEVSASVSAIANEKIKAEKEANVSKKKQAGKKKQLHVDKPEDDLVVNPYDALDDVDFM